MNKREQRTEQTLSELDPEFRDIYLQVLVNCAARGVELVAYCGERSPLEQAKRWRTSRTSGQVASLIDLYETNNAPWLAEQVRLAGPQHGPWQSDSRPGRGRHQWGKAADAYWFHNGKECWSTRAKNENGENGYVVYREESEKLGLVNGGGWKSRDWVHTQTKESGIEGLSWHAIDAAMRDRFGERPLCPKCGEKLFRTELDPVNDWRCLERHDGKGYWTNYEIETLLKVVDKTLGDSELRKLEDSIITMACGDGREDFAAILESVDAVVSNGYVLPISLGRIVEGIR